MLLMIDNYDSFTYNLVQYLGELGHPPVVVRNDSVDIPAIARMGIKALFISPGPCSPREAGISCDAIRHFSNLNVPIFGVCLGHQCIGEVFGGRIVHAPSLMHGKVSKIIHDGKGVFEGIPQKFEATRYHSLVIAPDSVPESIEVTARTEDGVIMGVRHRTLPVFGVQFHPESILTEHGHKMLMNFINLSRI